MSAKPFDREIVNNLERPISADINQIGTYADQEIRHVLWNLFATRSSLSSDVAINQPLALSAAFIGAGFKVRGSTSALQITLDAGLGFLNDNASATGVSSITGVDDVEKIKPLTLTATETITVPSADVTNPRIDIVEVKFDRRLTDSTFRDILTPSTGLFTQTSVSKTLTYNQNNRSSVGGSGSINYKSGTPAAGPSAPSADAGYVTIAQVYVPANATAIGPTGVMDLRRLLFQGGIMRIGGMVNVGPSGTTTSLKALSAPPGVEVTAYTSATSGSSSSALPILAIKVGDATQFRYDDVGTTAMAGSCVISQTQVITTPLLSEVQLVNGVNQSVATLLSRSIPPIMAMVGQPLLSVALGTPGVSGTTRFLFDINVQY